MKNEEINQEMNKRYGTMSVKEFVDKMHELGSWLDGYLDMIFPSLNEEVRGCTFSMILLADLGYSMGVREKLSRLAKEEQERIERKITMESKADTAVDNMLKDLGIRKENTNPDNNPFN